MLVHARQLQRACENTPRSKLTAIIIQDAEMGPGVSASSNAGRSSFGLFGCLSGRQHFVDVSDLGSSIGVRSKSLTAWSGIYEGLLKRADNFAASG